VISAKLFGFHHWAMFHAMNASFGNKKATANRAAIASFSFSLKPSANGRMI